MNKTQGPIHSPSEGASKADSASTQQIYELEATEGISDILKNLFEQQVKHANDEIEKESWCSKTKPSV